MVEIEFEYNNRKIIIHCNSEDKIIDILKKLSIKINKKISEIYSLYEGELLDKNSTFKEIANPEDKKENKMRVFVYDATDENYKFKNNKIKISKYIICPICKENIRLELKDYKIILYDCKNSHRSDKILLEEFEKTQIIDESKII